MTATEPEVSVAAKPEWLLYRIGGKDKAGRTIEKVYALNDNYVIYFADHIYPEPAWGRLRRWLRGLWGRATERVGCELFYRTAAKDLGKANSALARINRLLDDKQEKGSREYNFNLSTLEWAADALEMFFCEERTEALEILDGIRDKLQEKEEAQRRLAYQVGTLIITALPWILYLFFHGRGYLAGVWNPWMLAGSLAMAGGLFSVCLNIDSLEVNVNQAHWFFGEAGATRSVIAFLAGIGLLLAMRSKMFAGITYESNKPLLDGEPLRMAEMFFCFLAGFSESFVPNILSKSAEAKAADAKSAPDKAANTKAAVDKSAADKATADKSAADKKTADKKTPDGKTGG
jgi:hypothetical protein